MTRDQLAALILMTTAGTHVAIGAFLLPDYWLAGMVWATGIALVVWASWEIRRRRDGKDAPQQP